MKEQDKKPKKVVDKLQRLHQKHYASFVRINKDDKDAQGFLTAIKKSKENVFGQVSRTETKIFNEKWINIIAETIDSLEHICRDPKKFMKTISYITPIELAKKITSESVIHLSKHSQLVKEIDKKGNVIPNKILTVQSEDNYEIYENRFIKSLLNKLLIFIERRHNYIIKHTDTQDSDILSMKSKVKVGEVTYEFETKIRISIPSQDEGKREANARLFEKIESLRKRVHFLTSSELIVALGDCKPVASPILKTNIILKNPHYRKCHELWKFFDQYDDLGVGIRVKETKAQFTEEYFDELYSMMLNSVLTVQTNKTSVIDFNAKGTRSYKINPRFDFRLLDSNQLDRKFAADFPYVIGGAGVGPGSDGGGKGGGMLGDGLTAKQRAAKSKAEKELLRKEKKRLALLEAKKRAALLAAKRREELAKRKEEAKRLAKLREEERLAQLRERARLAREEERRKAREKALIEEELRRLRIARKKVLEKAMQDKDKEAKLALLKKEKQKELAKKRAEMKKQKQLENQKLLEEQKLLEKQKLLDKKKAEIAKKAKEKAKEKAKAKKTETAPKKAAVKKPKKAKETPKVEVK